MLRFVPILLLLATSAFAAPIIESEPASTIDVLDAGQTPRGVHLVWVQVLRRPVGDDGAPRTWVKLLRPVRKGHTVVFQPSKHKVELVAWLPKGPIWQLPVAWDDQGRIWQAWDEHIPPEYLDPQNLTKRMDVPLEPDRAWLGNPKAASRLVFDTLYDELREGKPTTVGTVTWLARARREATERPPGEGEYQRAARERKDVGIVPLWPGEWKLTVAKCDAENLTNDGSPDPVRFQARFAADGGLSVSNIVTNGLTRDASAHGFLRLLDRQRPRSPDGAVTLDRTFGLSLWMWQEEGNEGAIFGAILGSVVGRTGLVASASDDCSLVLAPLGPARYRARSNSSRVVSAAPSATPIRLRARMAQASVARGTALCSTAADQTVPPDPSSACRTSSGSSSAAAVRPHRSTASSSGSGGGTGRTDARLDGDSTQ